MGKETEIKFAAPLGFDKKTLFSYEKIAPFCGELKTKEMRTTYLDTEDFALRAAGISVRLRFENGEGIISAKTKLSEKGGVSVRGEWEIASEDTENALRKLAEAGAPCKGFIGEKLYATGKVTFTRTYALITPEEEFSFELSFDEGVFENTKKSFAEIELELKSGSEEKLYEYAKDFERAFSLKIEPRSKHARALDK